MAHTAAAADKRPTDGVTDASEPASKRFDLFTLDGILNAQAGRNRRRR